MGKGCKTNSHHRRIRRRLRQLGDAEEEESESETGSERRFVHSDLVYAAVVAPVDFLALVACGSLAFF